VLEQEREREIEREIKRRLLIICIVEGMIYCGCSPFFFISYVVGDILLEGTICL
jgi:hypothetical protein